MKYVLAVALSVMIIITGWVVGHINATNEAIIENLQQRGDALSQTLADTTSRLTATREEVLTTKRDLLATQTQLQEVRDKLHLMSVPFECIAAEPRYYDIPLSYELQDFTYSKCVEYGIEDKHKLMLAIMWQESNYNPAAIIPTNDYGLMQINIGNHAWLTQTLGIVDFLDPYQNITAGVYMMARIFQSTPDVSQALMVYNMGGARAVQQWENGNYSSNYSLEVIYKEDIIYIEE